MISIIRFLVLLTFALVVAALPQAAPAQPEDLDGCAKNCLFTNAAQNNCLTANNFHNCVCTNQAFQDAVATCAKKACVPRQVTILQEIKQVKCANVVKPVVNGN